MVGCTAYLLCDRLKLTIDVQYLQVEVPFHNDELGKQMLAAGPPWPVNQGEPDKLVRDIRELAGR